MATVRDGKGLPSRSVLKGAALLGGAALLSKLIGTLQKIPLQNYAGDEVFGLYSAVYALAVMWMTLAAAGVPTAVSVLVAEREAEGDEAGAQRVARWSLGLMTATGLAAFAVLQAGAGVFAAGMGAPEAAAAIRTSSIALLFSPAVAVLRGYRQGQLRMERPALSQIAEQIARVAFMLGMLAWALRAGWGAPAAAAAVHGGLAAGAAAGLAALLWPDRERGSRVFPPRRTGGPDRMPAPKAAGGASGDAGRTWLRTEPRAALVRRIVGVALPVAAASVVAPLFGLIDAFSIPRLLQQAGDAAGAAMADFGVYNRGVALLQLVLTAASGASAALVPALTAARSASGGEDPGSAPEAGQAAFPLRLAWWAGSAAAVGLALLAAPIDIALFSDDAGSAAIALLAPAALFGSLQAVSAGLLQGRGDLRSPAVNLAAAAVFKLALNVLLVPAWGIAGAAAGMTAAYAAAALLNALSLRERMKLPGFRPDSAWRPAAALAAMAAAVRLAELALGALARGMPDRAAALLIALPGVGVGAAVFAAALAAARAIGPREWREIPGCSAGSRLDRWLGRLWNMAPNAAGKAKEAKEG